MTPLGPPSVRATTPTTRSGGLHLVRDEVHVPFYYARDNPALAGLGSLAHTFGLRHAFDADHIAAIDNTTRKLLQNGKRSMGVQCMSSPGRHRRHRPLVNIRVNDDHVSNLDVGYRRADLMHPASVAIGLDVMGDDARPHRQHR